MYRERERERDAAGVGSHLRSAGPVAFTECAPGPPSGRFIIAVVVVAVVVVVVVSSSSSSSSS